MNFIKKYIFLFRRGVQVRHGANRGARPHPLQLRHRIHPNAVRQRSATPRDICRIHTVPLREFDINERFAWTKNILQSNRWGEGEDVGDG